MSEDSMNVCVLGREIGTATGWAGLPGEIIWFYSFQPAYGVNLLAVDRLEFNEGDGWIVGYDKDNNVIYQHDAPTFLSTLPAHAKQAPCHDRS
jgi:hypothetical protein